MESIRRANRVSLVAAGERFNGIFTRDFSTSPQVKKVGIIGAGVAGLQMVRSLKARGIDCVAFDGASKVGGLWQENYVGYGLQVPKQLYEFPDFPFQKPWGYYPTGAEVQQYIEDFADEYELNEHVKLNTKVDKIERRADGKAGWTFRVSSGEAVDVDYAVVSSGMYSTANPFLPNYEGADSFAGAVLHSSQYLDSSVVAGKNVIVVGGGKSAADIACDAANKGAASTTYLYRNAHWPTPREIAWVIPFQYVFLSRLGQQLVSLFKGGWPTAPAGTHLFHSILSVPMRGVFALVEGLFALQLGLFNNGRYPSMDVVKDFCALALPSPPRESASDRLRCSAALIPIMPPTLLLTLFFVDGRRLCPGAFVRASDTDQERRGQGHTRRDRGAERGRHGHVERRHCALRPRRLRDGVPKGLLVSSGR